MYIQSGNIKGKTRMFDLCFDRSAEHIYTPRCVYEICGKTLPAPPGDKVDMKCKQVENLLCVFLFFGPELPQERQNEHISKPKHCKSL